MNNKIEVIGIDHGWSNIKTSSQVFVTGVKEITTEPALFDGVLEYKGRYYKVGGNRQEVKSTKTEDDTFYLLTLAAVAKELRRRGLCEAKVFLAVGLPLTRFGSEKSDFVKYLTAERDIEFLFENIKYHVVIENVAVFPQCYAAVADKLQTFNKKTLIVDIGSWTIDIMPVVDKVPDESKCVTIPKGLITCMRTINEQCVRQLNGELDESFIQDIMRFGRCEIDKKYYDIAKAEIEAFCEKVYNSIREYGYNLSTTPIVFVGGGASVMPRYKSSERDENGGVVYKDVCNPITAEFREELYGNILEAFEQEKSADKSQAGNARGEAEMPQFSVTVTPYEREGSNIRGLARIYFDDSFIVNNVSILQGKDKVFVAMPSYKTKQTDEHGKAVYQDVCYPVTKEFREKLYSEIVSQYEKAKEQSENKAKEAAQTQAQQSKDQYMKADGKELPFR